MSIIYYFKLSSEPRKLNHCVTSSANRRFYWLCRVSWRSSGYRVLVKSVVIPKDESSAGSVDSCGRFWVVTFTGIHLSLIHI